jgi:hypothetical protein
MFTECVTFFGGPSKSARMSREPGKVIFGTQTAGGGRRFSGPHGPPVGPKDIKEERLCTRSQGQDASHVYEPLLSRVSNPGRF